MKYILIAFFALIFSVSIVAQEVQAYALMDTSKIKIGEQAKIDIFISYKTDAKLLEIRWPEINDSIISKVEVVNVSRIDTTFPDKNDPKTIQQHQTIFVTSFDSGFYVLPGFKFVVNDDTSKKVETQSLMLEVYTVQTDTSEASIKDIKPIFEEEFDWKEYLPYVYWGLGIMAIIAAIVLITYYLTKRKKPAPIIISKPKIPPHITALKDLDEIRNKKLWQEGKIKEYYTAVTDVIRVYIEGRYEVMAMELTSIEIMQVMRSQVIDSVSKEKLQQMLNLADMVKFAKAQPIDVEHELLLANAYEFVRGTLREEITPETSQFNHQPKQ